ncbi:MAG TPA: diacylglycerol kinase family protein [Dehalococcoidia bacterium]
MSRSALFIVNPAARNLPPPDRLAGAPAWLRLHGWRVAVEETASAAHAAELAASAARDGLDAVVAVGGDGTVNSVVNGLAGSNTALAVIPAGTANVWAKEVRLPRAPSAAAQVLHRGERRRVDLGRVGERYFLLFAGAGFDGHVNRLVPPGLKRRLGATAFVLTGLREAARYRPVPARLTLDGEELAVHLVMLVVGNIRNYGGVVEVTDRAVADDGLLDVCAYVGRSRGQAVANALRTLARRHNGAPGVLYRQAREVLLEPAVPLPLQVDGEDAGDTPARFRVVPRALTVVVPPGLESPVIPRRPPAAG